MMNLLTGNQMEKKYCDYGCGREAIHQFQNGNWCCNKSPNKCPVNRKKNSEANEGKIITEEARKKMSESGKIKVFSEDHKRKLRDVSLGKKNHFYGKHHTEESKKKMGEKNWKGGCDIYWRNEMKKIYKECYLCKSTKNLVMHHRDGNHDNNKRFNRVIICAKCHVFWHLVGYKITENPFFK